MSYTFGGKRLIEDRYYGAVSEDEARAKYAYFREAESKINGGPATIQESGKCGTNGGYMKHFRRKEERCAPCKAAHTVVELKRQRAQAGNRIRRRTTPEISPKASKIGSDNPKEKGVRNGTH